MSFRTVQLNLPNSFEIKHVLECKRCAESCPRSVLLEDYVKISVGLTDYGLQIWCKRHQANVVHIDFRNQKIRLNATAAREVIWPVSA